MSLNAKLVVMMLSLLIIAMLTLFALNQYSQKTLVQEIQDSSTEVSKAIQISVEDLTSEAESHPAKLREYLRAARTKGINEINIISNEGEIINSSDPSKVGKRREIKTSERGLRQAKGAAVRPIDHAISTRPYDLVVPVIVGDEQLGYVHINLLLDNIREIQHDNFMERLVATSLVFLLGIVLTFYLARRYTRPIHTLVEGVQKVSSGDLSLTFPVRDRDEMGVLAESFNEMVRKLRERELLEKRLYEAEHLSKVGQLASGIAHEIRNPLNYISLAIDHLRSELLPGSGERRDELLDLTERIKEEVRRANYMVLNFMNYGRPLKVRPADVCYRELLDRVVPQVAERLAEQGVELVLDIDPDLPVLRADPELLRTCLFNFISNAAQSMPEGGVIRLGGHFDADAGRFLLTFADQGAGIPQEDLDKIFQPYFTTKEAGIGLGLAITERIIREHAGQVSVANNADRGVTFTVSLPQQKEEP